ncbi:LETM1 domain-containing protein 1 isoform X2 [Poeciliopsis prolifica]|uniref:LETM1 domain-containing protein 1 isoform X2 n=1 Tax=Poeciliopsis prolifica TaxID=188132 RepID=UPI002413A5F9|nr:LETM1 domain-containing protein 1 isoform X2 [Poeciliopsis prolifica]
MALSCSSLCSRLSLTRLSGLSTNRITHCFYLRDVSCQSRLPLCRHFTSSKVRRGIGRFVSSKFQWANAKYEGFLKRRFPRFFLLYHTFKEGFRMLFQDAREVKRIKKKMLVKGVKLQDLPYREMEKLRQFRRDLIKVIPLVIITIPPFANYLIIFLMYFFPRQLLIPHFWTSRQQLEFRKVYHSHRTQHHQPVLKELEDVSHQVKNGHLQGLLKNLCTKVQRGGNPNVSEILAVRSLFSKAPLAMNTMRNSQMRHISPLLFLTTRLPGFLIGRRLNSHAVELFQLDRALSRMGPHQLSEWELKQACYVRGMNADSLDTSQSREWLSQWLQVSTALKESELSLLLHCMVLMSANYPSAVSRH